MTEVWIVLGVLWLLVILEFVHLERRIYKLEHEIWVRNQGWRKAE